MKEVILGCSEGVWGLEGMFFAISKSKWGFRDGVEISSMRDGDEREVRSESKPLKVLRRSTLSKSDIHGQA